MNNSEKKGKNWLVRIIVVVIVGFIFLDYVSNFYNISQERAMREPAAEYGTRATESVTQFYNDHQRLPKSLEEAKFNLVVPSRVKEILLGSKDGVITITVKLPYGSGKEIIQIVSSFDENKQIVWKYSCQGMRETSLPRQCKH